MENLFFFLAGKSAGNFFSVVYRRKRGGNRRCELKKRASDEAGRWPGDQRPMMGICGNVS